MMTLEDFFTLTEIKNGLTAPCRVEELINVMQKEKDCFVKNVSDATRHWAAVAGAITATENKDCLDLFIQLDGLSFIQRWLKDAQKFRNDTNDSTVEESIIVLLQALKKLHITAEKSISSGILFTVKGLYENSDHGKSRFGKELSVLLDRWMQEINDKDLLHDAENVGVHFDDASNLSHGAGRSSAPGGSVPRELSSDGKLAVEPVRGKILSSESSDALHPDKIKDSNVQSPRNELDSHSISGNSVVKDRSPDLTTNAAAVSVPMEDVSKKEETSLCSVGGGTSAAMACSSPVAREGSDNEQLDGSKKLNELPELDSQVHKIDGSSGRSCVTEKSDNSTHSPMQDLGSVMEGFDAANGEESAKEASAQQDNDGLDNAGVSRHSSSLDSERVTTLDSENGKSDKKTNYSSMPVFKSAGLDAEHYRNTLRDLSLSGSRIGKHEDRGASFSRMEDFGQVNGERQPRRKEDDDVMTDSEFSKPKLNPKTSNIKNSKSDMELEYGIVDALEVARQVAQEVEREVVEYREPSCSSSSDKISDGGIRQLGKLDTITEKQDLPADHQGTEVQSAKSHVAESYSDAETCLTHPDNVDTQPENLNEMESSLVTEAAQGADTSTEKGFCEFDLNQDAFNDDAEQLVTPVSLPVSVISVSRPAAPSGLPLTPLQFEGALGWRGSAATSAFRPASPRKVPDSDRTLSSGGNSDSSKQRPDFLDIDLNVAETGDETRKQNQGSSFPQSRELLIESGQRRSGGLKLDLNCVGEDVDAPASDLRMEGHFNNQNSYSASPACSSSSLQPLVRNIDLNDRPFVQGDASDQGPVKYCQNTSAYGGSNKDASVISIMGTRVEVSGKDFALRASSLPNGRTVEPAGIGATLARTGDILGMGSAVPYHQTPFIGYNGLTPRPTISFSTMYEPSGSIPYMVDSRGAAVMPQIMGPMSAVPPSSYSHTPFFMGMTDSQLTPNGVAHSRPKFDLNSGLSDSGGLKQFLFPGHLRSMEEQLRQPSSSGVGAKRKEPDCPDGGWEGYGNSNHSSQDPVLRFRPFR
ncbi:uncharacterized protein LOC111446199 isoform X1 [Cucurbita moschata]|uniref:Uncharacterized protein LOC111446199 isoform X1 n=1 Tax=Cucurbita moschata TaxID=3662 RepID=A0A6J1FKA7_CUCMO|nr:uncharacterized protein LOC111446199 isoform X1 [Cucurbita moschata]XP_022940680.1 uncharacterized protein LOC111446199 isoform X1 [Cucurbita moschata]XP_022940682.1 uncharacterized protein LOC111446199 isoform X1 [Cucurbita moschata]